jgi:tetratricopeptide (TPR) repeat protein
VIAFLLLAALADADSLREGERLWRMKYTRSAIAAFEKAARVRETAAAAQLGLGRIYYFKGFEAEGALPGFHEEVAYREKALQAFEAALTLQPASAEARLWRYRTLHGLGRATGEQPPPPAPPVDLAAADEIQKLRAEKKYAELLEPARAFAQRFPESERLPSVYDALIEAQQAVPDSLAMLTAAIDARIAARPDPAAYAAGANALLARGEYDAAAKLAEALVPATATFVEENLGSYKLQGKATASLNRARATSLDLVGWTLFLKGDLAGAETKLLEAERLSRAQDFTNQVRLAELYAKKRSNDDAREHYLNALSLTGGAPAQRAAATKALAASHAGAGFDAWLDQDLARRREERRTRMLASLVDRPLPQLPLTSLSGEPFDASKLRGRVLLYKFFASW